MLTTHHLNLPNNLLFFPNVYTTAKVVLLPHTWASVLASQSISSFGGAILAGGTYTDV
ncbi:MAG: hypothetical protein RMY27_05560 [Nostoc sp. DedQUE09]|nr:hypothetical protein [Nostoc sp. DedQUE09]